MPEYFVDITLGPAVPKVQRIPHSHTISDIPNLRKSFVGAYYWLPLIKQLYRTPFKVLTRNNRLEFCYCVCIVLKGLKYNRD